MHGHDASAGIHPRSSTDAARPSRHARARGTALARRGATARRLARIVYEHLEGQGLVGFGAADDHLHLQVASDRLTCGQQMRSLAGAIHKRLGHVVAFEPSRYRPIETSRHERNTYLYGFRQETRHGTSIDPLFDASSLPDRIGARVLLTRAREPIDALLQRAGRMREIVVGIAANGLSNGGRDEVAGGLDPRDRRGSGVQALVRTRSSGRQVRILGASTAALARRRLPRVRDEHLLELVGGSRLLEAPLALELVGDAAAAAVGLGALDGHDPATVLARRAAVQLAMASMKLSEVGHLLGLPRRTVQRDAAAPTTRSILRAVELQLRMRSVATPATIG